MPERVRVKLDRGMFLIDDRVYMERTYMGKIVRRKAIVQGENAVKRGQPTKALRDEFKKFSETIDNRKWEELESSKQRSASLTIKDFLEEYKKAAKSQYASHGAPRPATVDINAGALLIIIKAAGLTEVDRVDRIDRNTVQKYVDARCGEGSDRARISAWSTIAHARSCFAKWAIEKYQTDGIKINSTDKWPKPPKHKLKKQYQRPPEHLRCATMDWYREAEEKNPALWVASTLMIQLAMRPISASSITWENIYQDKSGRRILSYMPSKTEGRTEDPRPVAWPLPTGLFEKLKKHGGVEFVVPGKSHRDRYDLYMRTLNKVMRGLGWDRAKYSKACYELRKLCIDAVFNELGAERASQISGDNIETVIKFYADPNKAGFDGMDISRIISGSEETK